MCDYSLHAVATRPAEVGETIVTTTFRGTSTRGFASEADMSVAVCLLPGTELAFADSVRYDNRWIWTRTISSRVGKFGKIDPHIPDRHHDAIEFPWQLWIVPRRRRRLCRYDLRAYCGYRRAVEGTNPGSHLVQNDAQGKNVRPVILGSALDLLRREIGRSPDEFSGP